MKTQTKKRLKGALITGGLFMALACNALLWVAIRGLPLSAAMTLLWPMLLLWVIVECVRYYRKTRQRVWLLPLGIAIIGWGERVYAVYLLLHPY